MSLIDIHFHGTESLDIKEATSTEQLLLIAKDYENRGVDGFLFTIYPDEIANIRNTLLIIKKAMQIQTEGAKIYGAYLEGPFINPSQAGALNSQYFLMPNLYYFEKLLYGFEDIIKIITIAPELSGASKIIEKCCELGITVSMGHSEATFKEAQDGFQAGAKLITHLFNAMRGIHHREPGIAGFGVINQEIYVELIGDGMHLHDEIIKWIFSIKNPDRIILVSDMVKKGFDSGKIKGGTMSLQQIKKRLSELKIDNFKIENAVDKNPRELLKI